MFGWSAVFGGIAAVNQAKDNKRRCYGLTMQVQIRYMLFENVEHNLIVEFSEDYDDYLNAIRASKDEIKYKGYIFKLKEVYYK